MLHPDHRDRQAESHSRRSAAFVCLAALTATSCTPPPAPEHAVETWISDAAAAFEAGDRRELLGMISDNYADSRGHERDDIDRLLRLHFLRNPDSAVAAKIDDVTIIAGTAASVSLTAGVLGDDGGTFGFSADAWNLELELEKNGDDWLLIGARWSNPGERPY